MIETLGSLGAGLVIAALHLGFLFAAVWVGVKTAARTERNWIGWVAGLGTFAVLILIFLPALDALDRVKCAPADDFEACLEGDGEMEYSV